ncbi:C-type lectin-like [Liasis olivaceus]
MGLSMYLCLCCLGILVTNPFLGAKAESCPRQWLQKQGNCYGYFDRKLKWEDAEVECQAYGRGCHLASVLSKGETMLMSTHIKDQQKVLSDVWIGLNDISGKRRWRWADESTYNYNAWMPRQPDNVKNIEHCVELKYSSGKLTVLSSQERTRIPGGP